MLDREKYTGGKAILCHVLLRSGLLKSQMPWIFRVFRFGEYGMQRFNNRGLRGVLVVVCEVRSDDLGPSFYVSNFQCPEFWKLQAEQVREWYGFV